MARPVQRSAPAGSLSDWLRGRSDEQLIELLRRRPDLGLPAPADFGTLASRVSVRTSVQRAVDGLDAGLLRVLEALVLSLVDDRVEPAAAAALLGRDQLGPLLDPLLDLALVWGAPSTLHLVAGVREAVGMYPAGLGRPADVLLAAVSDVVLAPVLRNLGLPPQPQPQAGFTVADVLADGDARGRLLEASDEEELDVLRRLAGGPPIGLLREPIDAAGDGQSAPLRLVARGLLIPVDTQTVELPRELGLALRGERPLGPVAEHAPVVATTDRGPAEADRSGTTAVLELIRLVESLGQAWSRQPAPVLRNGGLGVRELRRTARELDGPEATAALVIEIAAAAGLVAMSHTVEPSFLPTSDYDLWRRHEPAQRWVQLAAAWLAMTRQPSLAGERDERDRPITVLGPDAERGTLPALRRQVLESLLELPPGGAPVRRADVLDRLSWRAPRRAAAQRSLVTAILNEADGIGVTSAGGLTGYGRALLAGSTTAAESALAIALPLPVDHILVQPDLTIVVPGPPEPELAHELDLVADLESTGGASVYRITDASVRRALDRGRTATELSALLATRSRTPIPQALSYLIEDVGRRHGVLRSGAAAAYLRCDDQALLDRVLAERTVDGLDLRRLAPTVAVSPVPVARLLEVLRSAGFAPAAEAPDGGVLTLPQDQPRAPSRAGGRIVRLRPAIDSGEQAAELVRRIRAGDSMRDIARRTQPLTQQVPGVTSASTLGLLRDAIRNGRLVWLGFVDSDGTASQHTILPISLAGGVLRGHDPNSARLLSYPLHRITTAGVVED
ncbi:MAG: helicase-associated domain-containing protein [Actinobacteria bacterium]|nr:helicase-associated domain-containing protein [Actinomycetota bacterium]